jgi:hypothetical protein
MPLSANGKSTALHCPTWQFRPGAPEPETEVEQRVAEFGGNCSAAPGPATTFSGARRRPKRPNSLELGDRFDFAAPLLLTTVPGELAAIVTARAGTGGGDV